MPDIESFYDTSHAIVLYNESLLQMVTNAARTSKLLAPGRIIILRDHVGALYCSNYVLTRSIALQDKQCRNLTKGCTNAIGGVWKTG